MFPIENPTHRELQRGIKPLALGDSKCHLQIVLSLVPAGRYLCRNVHKKAIFSPSGTTSYMQAYKEEVQEERAKEAAIGCGVSVCLLIVLGLY